MRLHSPAAQAVAELAVALSDGDRLSRGRTYQRKGLVRDVHVSAGVVEATVGGSRDEPYTVFIAVRAAGDNVAHDATTDPSAAAPGPGDIGFSCSCPDWGDPCKHGVAALLALAREIDDDVALLLRWRGIDGVVVAPPPGTESLITRAASSPSSFDPDADLDDAGGVFGARPGRRPRRFGTHDPDALDDDPDLDDPDDDAEAVFDQLVRRGGLGGFDDDDATPLVPDPGSAVRELRRRLGPAERSVPRPAPIAIEPVEGLDRATAIDRIRRGLEGALADPATLGDRAAGRPSPRRDTGPAGYDDGPLATFFDGAIPDAIGAPIPLGEDQLDAYHLVRIPIENIDAAPVIADALDTIADHWLTR